MNRQDLTSLIALIIAALALVTSQFPPLYEFFKKPYIELSRMTNGADFFICSSQSDLYLLKQIRLSNMGTKEGHIRSLGLVFNQDASFLQFHASHIAENLEDFSQHKSTSKPLEIYLQRNQIWQYWVRFDPDQSTQENILKHNNFSLKNFSLLEIVLEGDHKFMTITNGYDHFSYDNGDLLNVNSSSISCKQIKTQTQNLTDKNIGLLLDKFNKQDGKLFYM